MMRRTAGAALVTVIDVHEPLAELVVARFATVADHAAAAGIGRAERQWQRLLARAAVRGLIQWADGRMSVPFEWHTGPDNRPCLIGADRTPGPDVSISHSGSLVAVAMAPSGRIGIDCEYRRPDRNFKELAAMFGVVLDDPTPEEFYRWWTITEAMVKAADPEQAGPDVRWFLYAGAFGPFYALAVAWRLPANGANKNASPQPISMVNPKAWTAKA